MADPTSDDGPESDLAVLERARARWPESVRFSDPHATERIVRFRIPLDHVGEVIRRGRVTSRRFEGGEWRYRIEGRTSDRRGVACVVTFEEQGRRLVIVTVFRRRSSDDKAVKGERA